VHTVNRHLIESSKPLVETTMEDRFCEAIRFASEDPEKALQTLRELTTQLSEAKDWSSLQNDRVTHETVSRILEASAGEANCAVCAWLHLLWSSALQRPREFVLDCVPIMLWSVLVREAAGHFSSGLVAVLLSIYLSEKALWDGGNAPLSQSKDVVIPDLRTGSAFHEGLSTPKSIHVACLKEFDTKSHRKEYPEIRSLTSQSLDILSELRFFFLS